MLRYQRRSFAVCIVMYVLLGVARVFFFDSIFAGADPSLPGTVYFLSMMLTMFFFVWYMQRKNKRIANRYKNCFIEEYIWIFDLEYRSARKERVRRVTGLNLAAGLYSKGRFREAVNVLLEIGPMVGSTVGACFVNSMYFNNLGVAYAALGEIDAAKECLERIGSVAEYAKSNPKIAEKIEKTKANIQRAILTAEGKYEESLKSALELGPLDEALIARVSHNFGIALCYENLGDVQKAKEYYEFAAANGGDTFYAERAKEKLTAWSE